MDGSQLSLRLLISGGKSELVWVIGHVNSSSIVSIEGGRELDR